MKKIISLIFVLFFATMTSAEVPLNQVGGQVTTVAVAKTLLNDSKVILEGVLVKSHGNEKYEFKDNTGSIIVEIDDDLWYGRSIYPNQQVRIKGEVDKKWYRETEIEVDYIEFITK